MFVEIPAFILVIVTGSILLVELSITTWLAVKIAMVFIAIAANIYCVWLVFARVKYSRACNWDAFDSADHLQHKVGAIVLVGILGALAMGLVI